MPYASADAKMHPNRGRGWRGEPHAMAQLTLWLSRLCVYLLFQQYAGQGL